MKDKEQNHLKVLTEDEIKKIHHTSLCVLEEIGVHIPDEEILGILYDYGAKVDRSSQIAKFTPEIVESAIASAGKKYTLYGRDRDNQACFGQGQSNFLSSSGQYSIVDEKQRSRREPTLEDLRKAVRLGDVLNEIDMVGAMVIPLEVPTEARDIYSLVELLKNTTKPISLWIRNKKTCKKIIEILSIVSGSTEELKKFPMLEILVEPISPLRYDPRVLGILYEVASTGLPFGIGPIALSSATAPATLAGTLVQENAEILSAVVITQAITPGLPLTYWGIPHIMDVATTSISFGSPEQAIMAVAMTQLGKSYGFPVGNNVGLTDAKIPDAQAGIEKGMTLLAGALAGADIFGHMGISGMDQGASLAQLVLDNEMAGYLRRILRGLEVDEETLALEVIRSVGIGGNYLDTEHTVRHFRREYWFPKLFDRNNWERWVKEGAKTVLEKALEIEDELLTQYQCTPLEDGTLKEINQVVASAEKELLLS